MNKILITVLFLSTFLCFSQEKNSENWTINERAQYKKLTELTNYVNNKEKSQISKDSLFIKYIYFDYVLKDTVNERKERRLASFDTIFYYFRKTVDSIGIKKLDAKPIRFYKNHEIYEPFDEEKAIKSVNGEKMYSKNKNVFAYFRKEEPDSPLGALLFEPNSNKLAAWIMINQGGYKYFLTFNLF